MARVFVTGLGVYCAGGKNEEEFTDFLFHGKCGIRKLNRVNTSELYTDKGGEIDLPRDDYSSPTYKDIATKISLLTAEMAVQNAGLDLSTISRREIGLILGVTCGGMDSQEEWVRRDIAGQSQSPMVLEESLFHTISNTIAARYNIQGPVSTVTIACAAGTNAIGYGFDLIKQGKAKVVLVGGADVITQLTFAGFCSLRAMSPDVCRPFDIKGNGIALGDGCGILVLEDEEFAAQRGARVRAEILGYGACNDGYHGTTPSPVASGLLKSILHATRQARVSSDDIEYVNLHGTGTDSNDHMETYAVKTFFGQRAEQLPVSCTKSSIGHTLGAAGAVETIASILAMENDFMPPSVNVTGVNPELGINLIANKPLKRPMNCFMNVNSAFAGNNASVVIKKPEYKKESQSKPKHETKRIVVTGLGVILPIASDLENFRQALQSNESAIAEKYEKEEHGEFSDFSFTQMSGMKNSVLTRQMDRYAALSVLSALQAFKHGNVDQESGLLEEAGSVVGSGYGCLATNTKFFRTIAEQGNPVAKPVLFQKTVSNTASGFISIIGGAKGLNTTLNNGDISGLEAVHYGAHLLNSGKSDLLYAGGVDSTCDLVEDIFSARGTLAQDNAVIPFSQHASGAMITEGAAGLVLETMESALQRKAAVHGEILGWGQGFKGHNAPFTDLLVYTMNKAISESGLAPENIDLVIAHANGNPQMDEAEWLAVEQVFSPGRISLSSVKGKVGEAMGAGGVCSLIAGILAIKNNMVFGMGNLGGRKSKTILPVEKTKEMKIDTVLINALDHGGGVISVILKGFENKM